MTDYQQYLATLIPRFDREMKAKGTFDATCPNHGADTAEQLQHAGRWADAAVAWDAGADVSLGHNRRDRYRNAASHCRRKAEEAGNAS